jgi:tetratricopeptide (TPR) repeat protein
VAAPTAEERRALQARIDELWDFEDAHASQARFRDAIASEPPGWRRDVVTTQLARSLGLQGRFDEAREILAGLDTSDREVAARVRLERGRTFNSGGDPAAARPESEAAYELATAGGLEFLAIDALHMIAIVVPTEEQTEWHDRAIDAARAADDPRARRWLASLYNNAGWTRFDLGRPEEALPLFEGALAERVAQGKPREIGIARWAVARALRELGRTDEALAIQEDLRRSNADAGTDDPYVAEELGECLLALGRADEARPYFVEAAEKLGADGWLVANEPDRIARLRELAASASGRVDA